MNPGIGTVTDIADADAIGRADPDIGTDIEDANTDRRAAANDKVHVFFFSLYKALFFCLFF